MKCKINFCHYCKRPIDKESGRPFPIGNNCYICKKCFLKFRKLADAISGGNNVTDK